MAAAATQGQFNRLVDSSGQVDEFFEFKMFAPPVHLALKMHLSQGLSPVADCRENGTVGHDLVFPKINDHGLARWVELEGLWRRDDAPRPSNVFAEREEGAMWLEVIERFLLFMEKIDLDFHGIGFQIDQAVRRCEFRCREVAAVQINDDRSRAIQISKL